MDTAPEQAPESSREVRREILRTERLTLRELDDDDAPFILELLNEKGFLDNIGDRGVRDLDGAREYIRSGPQASYREHGFGLFRVALTADDTPIGLCGLLKRPFLDEADIGFALLARHGGQGYAFEAAQATLGWGRAVMSLPRIVAFTRPGNEPSERLLGKLGLKATGEVQFPGYVGPSRMFVPVA